MIWDNDDFFGGMFDFNGDGRTDAVKAVLGCRILDEMEREGENKDDSDKQRLFVKTIS